MRYKFTDKEVKTALKEMVVLIDTREKKNVHIINWLDAKGKKYKIKKIDHGDYSAYIPAGVLKGIDRDLYFDKVVVIERKANIDEIAGNFSTSDYPRISKEFSHLKANGTRVRIFIEDLEYHRHLREGFFKSKYKPKTLHARIKNFEAEYNTTLEPIHQNYIASEIYNTLYYTIRDYLIRNFEIVGGEF